MNIMKLGIAGCGAIGSFIAHAIAEGRVPHLELEALSAAHPEHAEALAESIAKTGLRKPRCMPAELLPTEADVILEATTKSAMPAIVHCALEHGKPVIAMSVGGLASHPGLIELAEEKRTCLLLPSGALGGIDAILAAREAGIDSVELTTTKQPKSLAGAPYILQHNISLEKTEKPTLIFEGSAREAIAGFPANANVAVTLAFSGIGLDKTKVRFIADPHCHRTKQEIFVSGDFGEIHACTESRTAPDNPRTGYMAMLSALALLRKLTESVRFGT